jgi:hypothetical protein
MLGQDNGAKEVFRLLLPHGIGKVTQQLFYLLIGPRVGPLVGWHHDVPVGQQVSDAIEVRFKLFDFGHLPLLPHRTLYSRIRVFSTSSGMVASVNTLPSVACRSRRMSSRRTLNPRPAMQAITS